LAADEHQARCNGGLEDADEDAGSEKGLVVERCGSACCSNTPKEDIGG
jgi:hypothetical protein